MKLRPVAASDAARIAEIYAPNVTNSHVSFDTQAPDADEIGRRIAAAHDIYPWLVAEEAGEVMGYAYAGAFRIRHAYRFTVEPSVYVAPEAKGRGVASLLYDRLHALLIAQGYTQAVAVVALPNDASIRLHERFGYTQSGLFRAIGYKAGDWRDVGYWQRALAPLTDPPREPLRLTQLPDVHI